VALDANLREQLPVTLEGIVTHTARPLTVWVLGRGLPERYQESVSASLPGVSIRWLSCEAADYRGATLLAHITVSTMDRLLLPDLLPEVDRVVYLDIDALVLDDVGVLADLDLQGHWIAARPNGPTDRTAFTGLHEASRRLAPELAAELRRRVHAAHRVPDLDGFNAGVLVLALAQMRRERITERFLGWSTRYGLHDQQVLIAASGPQRVELPPRWNAWPSQETVRDPAVLHWLGPVKPWGSRRTPWQEAWRHAAAAAERRLQAAGGAG
jgi:lipopolysaccharide biosynthesis glycosyltransferase